MKRLIVCFCSFVAVCCPTFSNAAGSGQTQTNEISKIISFYYLKPQPERVPDIIQEIATVDRASKSALSPLTGFLAELFKQHPQKATEWVAANVGEESAQTTVIHALVLAGLQPLALSTMQRYQWQPDRIQRMKNVMNTSPDIRSLSVRTGAEQDMLWGAFFASGEEKYVLKVVDAYRSIAQTPGVSVDDIVFSVESISDSTKRDKLKERMKPYSDEMRYGIAVATAALWSLGSNAGQHERVKQILASYLQRNENSIVYRALARQIIQSSKKVVTADGDTVRVMLTMTRDPSFVSTQLPAFVNQRKPFVPDQIFQRNAPAFLAIIAMTSTGIAAQFETEVFDPTSKGTRYKPETLPPEKGGVQNKAAISATLIPIRLDENSPLGFYRAKVNVQPTAGKPFYGEISFLVEE